jgi:hypothetical protein
LAERSQPVNQPKFKFGEKVSVGALDPFVVAKVIQFKNGCFGYGLPDEADAYYPEEVLKSCEEPEKKKKLYAYTKHPATGDNEVKFFTEKLGGNFLVPVPDYDIEYPEAK